MTCHPSSIICQATSHYIHIQVKALTIGRIPEANINGGHVIGFPPCTDFAFCALGSVTNILHFALWLSYSLCHIFGDLRDLCYWGHCIHHWEGQGAMEVQLETGVLHVSGYRPAVVFNTVLICSFLEFQSLTVTSWRVVLFGTLLLEES